MGNGTPWLGFIVYPSHRRLKRRNVVKARRGLRRAHREMKAGRSIDALTASVRGFFNHARYGDTWGLRGAIAREERR